MRIKRIMIVGTIVVVMSFGSSAIGGSLIKASPAAKWSTTDAQEKDPLLDALNQASEEELYESLYEGKSLHEIAVEQGVETAGIIDLQTTQLIKQLDDRLRSGNITAQQHAAYKEEVRDLIQQSVLTSFG
ncbi:hypothetical protein ACTHPF_04620 [Paenibacillus sp. SAF-054]|uniref:hypothetical protein n=1 Tax=unclassified Paenibacillus TaxID=185978 RepID=UPI003F802105